MTRLSASVRIFAAFCACALASCESLHIGDNAPIPQPLLEKRKSIERLRLAPDAVVFDVLIAHVPYNERDLVRELWRDVDELELGDSKRIALNEQGIRVGLLGATPPESLSKLLALKGRELRASLMEEVDASKVESALEPISYSKPVSLRSGMKSTIVMRSDTIASAPVLEKNVDGELEGKTYSNVSPALSVAIDQSPDGSVLFDLAPYLRYGAPQSVTRYQHGQLVKTQEQPTKFFDSLRFSLGLRPGQFLVLGASDANTDALGRYFFNEGGDDFEQTVLVIRLLVTQHDGQIDRFPDFKEMISGDESYSEEFDNDFLKTAPDIVFSSDKDEETTEEDLSQFDEELDGDSFDAVDAEAVENSWENALVEEDEAVSDSKKSWFMNPFRGGGGGVLKDARM